MSTIHIKQPHQLTRDDAKQRVEQIARELRSKLGVDYQWQGNSLQFKRSGASGAIDCGDDFVEVNVKLGMLLTPMKGQIEESIKKNIESHLA